MGTPIQPADLRQRQVEFPATQMRQPTPRADRTAGGSFHDMLSEAVNEVQHLQNEADVTIKKLVSGEIKDVTETMVAVQKADMSFRTMMTVRSKVMEAYQEIMRMQV
jgi:flagellar hook-basal body complex protein FliE